MKWIFLSLLVVNIALISMQWLSSRGISLPPEYEEGKGSERLKLLSEVNGGLSVGERSALCLLLGPLESREQAGLMLKVLNGDDENARLVVQNVKKAPSYWVYYDNFLDKTALAMSVEFKLKEVDSYVVGTGKLKGSLSLGVFENIDLAYRLKKMMKKKGYDTKISEITKVDNEFWLLLSAGYAAENKKKIDEMLTPLKKMHEKREIMCKSVASEK